MNLKIVNISDKGWCSLCGEILKPEDVNMYCDSIVCPECLDAELMDMERELGDINEKI